VNFIEHLLHAHLGSSKKGTVQWQVRHAAMLQRLASTEDEVKLCEEALKVLEPMVDGMHVPPSAEGVTAESKSEPARKCESGA
jgi:hypothetical protein